MACVAGPAGLKPSSYIRGACIRGELLNFFETAHFGFDAEEMDDKDLHQE